MNIKPNILIFSVFRKENSDQTNLMAHAETMAKLKAENIPVLQLQGQYDGTREMSILVQGFEHRERVEQLCKAWRQECYLESHNDRATFLVYPDGRRQSIGTLVPVSKQEAEAVGSFSYNPVVGQYFVTR